MTEHLDVATMTTANAKALLRNDVRRRRFWIITEVLYLAVVVSVIVTFALADDAPVIAATVVTVVTLALAAACRTVERDAETAVRFIMARQFEMTLKYIEVTAERRKGPKRVSDYWREQPPERVRAALMNMFTVDAGITEVLAEALGYPRSEGGPNDPNGGGYVLGDHTSLTLAAKAGRALRQYQARINASAAPDPSIGIAEYLETLAGYERPYTPEDLRQEAAELRKRTFESDGLT
jgi:hypothetical protein